MTQIQRMLEANPDSPTLQHNLTKQMNSKWLQTCSIRFLTSQALSGRHIHLLPLSIHEGISQERGAFSPGCILPQVGGLYSWTLDADLRGK